ncbi:MAG TPA: uroporphyrinogen decarboxylase family protein [Candidatus Butyricicoccus avicola]|nr:uroporphyrinogen decarboxylase family protein [Candidatus Butyricicoccus avicola]
MKRNMYAWIEDQKAATAKKALPVLSFPSVQLLGITVRELINDSDLQAKGMKAVADRVPTAAAVSLMDLSLEAECFGSKIRVSDEEVPTVVGSLIDAELDEDERLEQAKALAVPAVGAGRTQIYIDAIEKAVGLITDRPVLAGVIGPFSLAGRLMDVTEAMIYCYDEPDMVHVLLQKATDFIIQYIKAYKAVGANGVVLAEPLAGLLSPGLAQEFSGDYCKQIVDAVQDESFIVVYHNCGNTAVLTMDSLLSCGAKAYHFGDAVDMTEVMEKIPSDVMALGNVSPAGEFRGGTPESIKQATWKVMEACCKYPNFVISSGCDIPPMSPWENIDAFFAAVDAFYQK